MSKKRHKPEEIVSKLRQVNVLTAQGTPVALVSLVDADRQFFKSCVGDVAEELASTRQTPLSHSFCQYTVAAKVA